MMAFTVKISWRFRYLNIVGCLVKKMQDDHA